MTLLACLSAASCLGQSITPPSGLVGWWTGDSTANDATYDPALGNNGTLVSPATYATGKVGNAFSFNGGGSTAAAGVVTIPETSSLTITNITVDAWIKPVDVTWRPIIEWGEENDNPGVHFWVGATAGAPDTGSLFVNIRDRSNTDYAFEVDNVIATNVWSFVAVTFNQSNGDAKLYLNGSLIGTHNFGTGIIPKTDTRLQIGQRVDYAGGDAAAGSHFYGLIDEVEIFNRVLSASELLSIYNAGVNGKAKVEILNPAFSSGQFQFTVHGVPGSTYTIEKSSDLSTWTTLSSGNAMGGSSSVTFVDSTSSSVTTARCYRAKKDGATTYSANTLGFSRVSKPSGKQFILVANQFNLGGNTLSSLLPGIPSGTVAYFYNSGTGNFDITSTYTGTWSSPSLTANPGTGFFLGTSSAISTVFYGYVPTGSQTVAITT
ncbi:MAG TPA: LamG domain-containing protein, partial [Candidatus Limnocylindria bacterium]|nr:LamG domain-containing protein [Candidatus Limnocylindria bacterium]